MNLAQKTKNLILDNCPGTFSLYAGYGMNGGEYIHFPTGIQLKEKRNNNGRVVFAEYQYADDSRLIYRYSAARETYSLEVKLVDNL